MKKTWLIFSTISLLILMTTFAEAKSDRVPDAQYYKNTITAARETVWKAITTGSGSCATVAVMDGGRLVYSECFGAAERSSNRPVDKYTRFNIGSTSKMFAAVSILLLVDDGKINLDEKIVKYIPDFTMKDERYKDITVRMLFNHSSGLPGSTFFFSYESCDQMHKLLLDNIKNCYLKHAPGEMSMYCNDGFTLAEIIVERISSKRFMDFVAERIFKPLEMKNSGKSIGECGSDNIAQYYDIKTGKKYPAEVVNIYACGGISSTAEDLCKFGNSFNPKSRVKLLSNASLAEIRKNQPYRFYNELKHRPMMSEFGWEYSNLDQFESKGFQVLGKGGNTLCYSTNLQIIPDEGISIALMVNGHVSGESLTHPILEALMKDKNLVIPPPSKAEKPVEAQKIPADILKFAGLYAKNMAPFKITFNKDENGFDIYPLTPIAKDKKTGVNKEPPEKDKNEKTAVEPVISYVYNGGIFHNFEKELKCYFTVINGRQYLVLHKIKNYGVDIIEYQKLDEIKNPVSLKTEITGQQWLVRNENPYILAGCIGIATVDFYEELPGYLNFAGIKKIETPDYASIAGTAFRDQSDLHLVDLNGETWLKSSHTLFSPAGSARKLIDGVNRVVIKSEGFNEWLKMDKGAIVNFEKPINGRIILIAKDEAVYDSLVDKDEIYAPEGSYIFFAGAPGDMFKVVAK